MMYHATTFADNPAYTRTPVKLEINAVIKAQSQLVRRIAWHVHSRMSTAIEVEDLIQIGMIALVEAARTFEDRGISFVPYASMRVRGAMIDELRRDARMCRSGMASRRQVAAVRAQLESELTHRATDTEMAQAMGLEPAAYHALIATTMAVRQDSIDEVYSDHDISFADASDAADTVLEKKQLRTSLASNIAQLPERERLVLQLYFVDEMNLDEIGATLEIGAARVCQIKKAAIERLSKLMK
jgi:RNA polymerase sigma factor FliA